MIVQPKGSILKRCAKHQWSRRSGRRRRKGRNKVPRRGVLWAPHEDSCADVWWTESSSSELHPYTARQHSKRKHHQGTHALSQQSLLEYWSIKHRTCHSTLRHAQRMYVWKSEDSRGDSVLEDDWFHQCYSSYWRVRRLWRRAGMWRASGLWQRAGMRRAFRWTKRRYDESNQTGEEQVWGEYP